MTEMTHKIHWNRLNINFLPNSYRIFLCFENLKYSCFVLQGWEHTQYPQEINVKEHVKQIKKIITVGKPGLTWPPSLCAFICF